jgi:glycerol-3-phosphate acyltransferase PlsX
MNHLKLDKLKTKRHPVIAVDIMSGDQTPITRLNAVLDAIEGYPDVSFILVGNTNFINENLPKNSNIQNRVQIVESDQIVQMHDTPKDALKKGKETSLWKSLNIVHQGKAHALVSASNTAALVSFSKIILGTVPELDTPAIAVKLPSKTGFALLLDAGASIHCSAEQLYQFALLGISWFATNKPQVKPKISLLNIGTESHKGDKAIKSANNLLLQDESIDYLGYTEGNNLLNGKSDIILCSGFTGNIALKTAEGVSNYFMYAIKREFNKSFYGKILLLCASMIFKRLRNKTDSSILNGAELLGINGKVIKSHGNANRESFFHAIINTINIVKAE